MRRASSSTVVIALFLAGCGSDEAAVTVSDAWARASAVGQTAGAAYFRIEAADDDRLVAASVPASVAGRAEIHEVVPAVAAGESAASTDDMTGADSETGETGEMGEMEMTMRELADGLALPAGETVSLEPGGYHLMLLDLVDPLEVGETFDVTLDFADADPVTVTVTVSETAP